ncbi:MULTISPECIES: response regulator transcription factor [Chryseobacterium]|uniref:DNA-binding response regulator n=1 Tax=Chryseobacterium cucumeris TaxID=1813611 RepID=A0ABX9X914_9FLAO|nr:MULTISPECIES: response regulator transcription factor [Chryseobacterium]KYH07768.1 DNA-binding response regulator [Chryseobacterium cucumeris]MDH5033953.1 response regulator transcription factor [Chryseobacterium cucumeris]QWT87402.1 response regulator transcription factor [Chryseobacterium sp. PCH239]ROH94763.1 DNA-binding response regulator [Chryseobacterium cucumeris]WFB67944.1 response regulator transcription factor [Chryseobacterium sp. WX]
METPIQNKEIIFLLADDHSIVRQGMEIVISDIVPNAKVYQTSSLHQVLELIESKGIEMAIIDAHFPDGNSLHILPQMKSVNPDIKILIFTGLEEELHGLKFIKAGADGYLSKLSEEEEVREAITAFIEKGEYFSALLRNLLVQFVYNPDLISPLNILTKREMEIAELYAEGYGNLEISNSLNIKQNTVSTIKKNIFEKLKIENIVELVELVKTHHKL